MRLKTRAMHTNTAGRTICKPTREKLRYEKQLSGRLQKTDFVDYTCKYLNVNVTGVQESAYLSEEALP